MRAGTTGKHIVTANQCYPGCSWLNLETVVNWIRQPERQLAHTHIAQIECSVVRVMVVRWSNSNHWTSGQMVSGCYLLDSVVNLCGDVYTLGVIYLCLVELDMHFLFGIRQNNLWPASQCVTCHEVQKVLSNRFSEHPSNSKCSCEVISIPKLSVWYRTNGLKLLP